MNAGFLDGVSRKGSAMQTIPVLANERAVPMPAFGKILFLRIPSQSSISNLAMCIAAFAVVAFLVIFAHSPSNRTAMTLKNSAANREPGVFWRRPARQSALPRYSAE